MKIFAYGAFRLLFAGAMRLIDIISEMPAGQRGPPMSAVERPYARVGAREPLQAREGVFRRRFVTTLF